MRELYQDLKIWEDERHPLSRQERLDAAAAPLVVWYEGHKRELPWRQNRDPYRIWISEIMLQQTRAEAVKPYFERFIKALPDIEALAAVPQEQLMKLWEGLGYYSRAVNLKKAAEICVERYEKKLPKSYRELLVLPGIGSYTAGAVSSIAYGERRPAVDGNVFRVIHRLTCDRSDITQMRIKKALEKELQASMERTGEEPGVYNQALMELGACVCIPGGVPFCEKCPLSYLCLAKKEGATGEIPCKKQKRQKRTEERTVFIVTDGTFLVIGKRPEKGLLAGLYELPGRDGFCSRQEAERVWQDILGIPVRAREEKDGKHVFTHVEWHMKAWKIESIETDSDCAVCFPKGIPAYTDRLAKFGYLVRDRREIQEGCAVPSAFSAWKKYWEA